MDETSSHSQTRCRLSALVSEPFMPPPPIPMAHFSGGVRYCHVLLGALSARSGTLHFVPAPVSGTPTPLTRSLDSTWNGLVVPCFQDPLCGPMPAGIVRPEEPLCCDWSRVQAGIKIFEGRFRERSFGCAGRVLMAGQQLGSVAK